MIRIVLVVFIGLISIKYRNQPKMGCFVWGLQEAKIL